MVSPTEWMIACDVCGSGELESETEYITIVFGHTSHAPYTHRTLCRKCWDRFTEALKITSEDMEPIE